MGLAWNHAVCVPERDAPITRLGSTYLPKGGYDGLRGDRKTVSKSVQNCHSTIWIGRLVARRADAVGLG